MKNSKLGVGGEINLAKDPVCGMEVDEKTKFKSWHMQKTYYFCDRPCKVAFDKNPMKYVDEVESFEYETPCCHHGR